MTLRQRLDEARRGGDRGAALVLALIFTTVVVVVMASVLAYADANIRATVALRRQASTAAAAEAAAEIAINALRKGTYNGKTGQCFETGDTMLLPKIHPASDKTFDSARVTCARDTDTSQTPSTGKPSGYALLALQKDATVEDAINIKVNGPDSGVNVAGDVGSLSNIVMTNGALNVDGSVIAKSCSGTINATPKTCSTSAPDVEIPDYKLPPHPEPAPGGLGNITGCAGSGTKVTFYPGVYTDLKTLNEAWSKCGATVFDFRPGIYYFAFSGLWTIDRGTTVAGSEGALPTTPPAIPGECPNPLDGNASSGSGVQFVFGAEARLLLTGNAQVEICARKPTESDEPPIAFYGLGTERRTGSLVVPAQSGCIVRTGSGSKCMVIQTDNHSSGLVFHIQGHVYQPKAKVDLDLRGSSDQFFSGGLTVRSLAIFSPASSTLPTPISSGPDQEPVAGRTIIFLTVYVCTEQLTCDAGTGGIRLRVKVGLADPSGTTTGGARGVTVYSWSVQR